MGLTGFSSEFILFLHQLGESARFTVGLISRPSNSRKKARAKDGPLNCMTTQNLTELNFLQSGQIKQDPESLQF